VSRAKANLARTYLCAVKLWRTAASIPTLASGVRHVVRKQGFSSKDIYAQERKLQRHDIIKMSEGANKTVRLTRWGNLAVSGKCQNVRLSPWTDPGYPGAELAASPRERRKRRRR